MKKCILHIWTVRSVSLKV